MTEMVAVAMIVAVIIIIIKDEKNPGFTHSFVATIVVLYEEHVGWI